MRIVIAGAGVVGSSLAEHLLNEGHTISVVEPDRAVCTALQERYDLMALCGTGTSPTLLEEAGLRGADMVIAVTPSDAANFLICGIARQFGVARRIARLRSAEFTRDGLVDVAQFGVTDVIDPERVVVAAIRDRLDSPRALETLHFHNRTVLLRSYRVTAEAPAVGKSLIELRTMTGEHPLLTVAVIRARKTVIPHGDFHLQPGDRTITLLPATSLPALRALMGYEAPPSPRKILVSGDSLTARTLAAELEKSERVILVDTDAERGRRAADTLARAEVLQGDLTDPDFMQELNAERADAFVGATAETEFNLMTCLLARKSGIPQVICVSHEPRHDPLLESIGIQHVVNPRVTIAREILETVMAGQLRAAVSIRNAGLQAKRLIVRDGSRASGARLAELWPEFHSEAIVGAIVREEKMIIPGGLFEFRPGDEAVVLSTGDGIAERVAALFEPPRGIVAAAKRLLGGS